MTRVTSWGSGGGASSRRTSAGGCGWSPQRGGDFSIFSKYKAYFGLKVCFKTCF